MRRAPQGIPSRATHCQARGPEPAVATGHTVPSAHTLAVPPPGQPFLLPWEQARPTEGVTSAHRLSGKTKRVCSWSTTPAEDARYLLHAERAHGGPVDLQDTVPGVDGIAVVRTDVHPVDPGPDRRGGRAEASSGGLTHLTCAGRAHQALGPGWPPRPRPLRERPHPISVKGTPLTQRPKPEA